LSSNKPLPNDSKSNIKYGTEKVLTLAMLRDLHYDSEAWDDLLDQMTIGEQSLLLTQAAFATQPIASVGKPGTKDDDGPTAIKNSQTGIAFPSEGIWASSFNVELIQKVGDALAEDALFIEVQGVYAPGINIHRTPYGGRAHEYFSEDAFLSAAACVAEIKGLQKKGIVPQLKHFAFNNEETQRNGICIWMNEQEAREIMLLPFEYAMRPSMGNVHGIMTAFNRAGCIWVSASKELMINMSRDEWGFDGYSITDMAGSNAGSFMVYSDGIINGTDCFLGDGDESKLAELAKNPAFAERMREASHRMLYVVCNYSAAMNGISSADRVVLIMPWWQILLTTLLSVFAVLAAAGIAIWVYFDVKHMVRKRKE